MSLRYCWRAAAGLLFLIGAAGCRDELPTAVGPDRFPEGALLTSLVLELEPADFLAVVGHFSGYTGAVDTGFGLVANQFEGSLEARTLVRLGAFPEAVTYSVGGTSITDSSFVYAPSQLVAPIDTAASTAGQPLTLRLHAVNQAWDAGSATWTHAVDSAGVQEPWRQPGGVLGEVLARTTWFPGDTVLRDTVAWQIDSLAVARMAEEDFLGLAVIAEGDPVRVQLGPFNMRAAIRPESRPDTVIPWSIPMLEGTFIFTPPVPPANGGWNAGGVASARTLFRVTLPDSVAGCPAGTPAGVACPRRAIRDVTLNEIALVLRPLPVAGGFRPMTQQVVRLREIGDPSLGRRAPLGRAIAESIVEPEFFAAPVDTTVSLPLTQFMVEHIARDTAAVRPSTAFALLGEPEGATFGHARFTAMPRLRIIYTLPVQRSSP